MMLKTCYKKILEHLFDVNGALKCMAVSHLLIAPTQRLIARSLLHYILFLYDVKFPCVRLPYILILKYFVLFSGLYLVFIKKL